MILQTANSRRQ